MGQEYFGFGLSLTLDIPTLPANSVYSVLLYRRAYAPGVTGHSMRFTNESMPIERSQENLSWVDTRLHWLTITGTIFVGAACAPGNANEAELRVHFGEQQFSPQGGFVLRQ